jgi:hypothetical protein
MGPFPDGSRLLVVEVPRVEQDENRVFTLVLCVAHRTLLTFVPMVPALLGHALRDLLVAGQAPLVRDFEVLVVALHAVLEAHRLGMRAAQRARRIVLAVFLGDGPKNRHTDQPNKCQPENFFFQAR